jgi:hypothetical protein
LGKTTFQKSWAKPLAKDGWAKQLFRKVGQKV